MNIGFVSAWNERGASYVTKSYMEALCDDNELFLYERGSDNANFIKTDFSVHITRGYKLLGTDIHYNHFKKWVIKNKLDIVFFNEQHDFRIVTKLKKDLKVIVGTYIDYYKKSWVKKFDLYDFLICNTLRHYSVFKNHKQCFYIRWGTNIDLFRPTEKNNDKKEVVFFHSSGMSLRKGTSDLIKVFVDNNLGDNSKLIIHTQIPISNYTDLSIDQLKLMNIEVIEKTVAAPGLYYLGDVYVYPTTLDGLGLTMYEALSSGLPVITTDNQPMNEVIDNNVGKLVDVNEFISRDDGYYWPLSLPNYDSLLSALKHYINTDFSQEKINARNKACELYNWEKQKKEIKKIFDEVKLIDFDSDYITTILSNLKQQEKIEKKGAICKILPDFIVNLIRLRKK